MKKMTKVMAVVLVAIMLFVYTLPVLATSTPAEGATKTVATKDSTANLTVGTGNDGDTLYAYRVVDATINANNVLDYSFTELFKAFQESSAKYGGLTVETYMTEDYKTDSDNLKALLGEFTAYVKTNSSAANYTSTTVTDGEATFSNVALGQYIIVGGGNTTGAIVYQTVTAEVIPEVEDNEYKIYNNYSVVMKTSEPSMAKDIIDGTVMDTNNTETANIGDDVSFKLSATVPTYSLNSTNTTFYFRDTLPTGLTLKTASIVVNGYVGETKTELVADTQYKVTTNGQNLYVDFVYSEISQYEKIEVDYKAELNTNAVLGVVGNTNTADLIYANDSFKGTTSTEHPEGEGYGNATEEAIVYTYGLSVTKVDGSAEEVKLPGAEFEIYADEACEGNIIDTIVTDENGIATHKGLAAGTYYLKETKAPAGYKLVADPIEVVVSGTSANLNTEGYVEIQVENVKGGSLPTTGGTGTIIFTVVGAILLIGASVLLITKFRMKNVD